MPDALAPGLWRWTASHPAWHPDAAPDSEHDWDRDVGSVLYVKPESAVFFDPLLPADTDGFWRWCDEAVGARSVQILTTIRFHGRSRELVAERYGGDVLTDMGSVPAGVEAFPFREADETIFWVPEHAALVPGDRIIGDGAGGVRLCPDSWLAYLHEYRDQLQLTAPPRDQADLRALLRALRDLPVERILVTHGAPLLTGGAAALERLLA